MIKVLFLALSVNEEILTSHFADSFRYINEFSSSFINQEDYRAVVYTQGFDYRASIDNVDFIRDDTVYNQGLSISEIRDYFTSKAIESYHPEYILHCDDDFKFREKSMKSVYNDIKFMEKHPEIGLSCMHYSKGGPDDINGYQYDFNPSRVATRSGILYKTCAYEKGDWGSDYKVRYFEECYLASMIYQKGYRIIHSSSPTIHKTKPTGLGLSLERKYGKNNIPQNGRKILHDQGLLTPSYNKDGSPRYDVPMRVSENLQSFHEINLKFRLSKD